jgi:hypothetical protein
MAGSLVISTLNNDTGVFATQNGMTGICKAWVNYNAVTQTIAGSFNVSSMTYSAAGTYIMNFTTAMSNANYVAVGAIGKFSPLANDANAGIQFKNATGNSSGFSTTQLYISVRTPTGNGAEDYGYVGVSVFGS